MTPGEPGAPEPFRLDPAQHGWDYLAREEHADCRFFKVFRNRCRHRGDGREDEFFTIAGADWSVVLALTPGGRELVMVRQFRFGSEDFSWEMPAGVIDPGEDPVAAGVRELREETGYVGRGARLLRTSRPNPALQSTRCHFVLVEDARPVAATAWDPHEEIEARAVPVAEVIGWGRSGVIEHAVVLNALFYLAAEPELWRGDEGEGR